MSSTASKSENQIPGWYVEFQAAILRQAPRPGEIDQFTAEGWTSNQASLKKNLVECLVPPTANGTYGKLTAVCVHKKGEEWLDGKEYLRRARAKSGGRSDQKAFDFYAENQHLLPNDKDGEGNYAVNTIVFPDTEFASAGSRCARYLCRYGASWRRHDRWVCSSFPRPFRVAVPAISPETSDS